MWIEAKIAVCPRSIEKRQTGSGKVNQEKTIAQDGFVQQCFIHHRYLI